MNYRSALRIPTSVAILTAGLSTLCFAQSAKSRMTITHVRPEMVNEWVDLQKNEMVPALKKAGVKSRTVYSSGLFGNAYEYVVVTPMEKFAISTLAIHRSKPWARLRPRGWERNFADAPSAPRVS